MTELTPMDVDLYTNGRLRYDAVETNRILQRALVAARRYCEWHVTPVKEDHVVTLDGPGRRVLMLPTKKLVTLTSVVEDGVTLDVSNLKHSGNDGPVLLVKQSWTRWSCDFQSITVTMDHGYDDAEAQDWRLAVLDACDRFSQMSGLAGLKRYKVRDVEREWFEAGSSGEIFNTRLIEPYRINVPH